MKVKGNSCPFCGRKFHGDLDITFGIDRVLQAIYETLEVKMELKKRKSRGKRVRGIIKKKRGK